MKICARRAADVSLQPLCLRSGHLLAWSISPLSTQVVSAASVHRSCDRSVINLAGASLARPEWWHPPADCWSRL